VDVATAATVVGDLFAAAAVVLATVELRRSSASATDLFGRSRPPGNIDRGAIQTDS
jgi:hypothetical protein